MKPQTENEIKILHNLFPKKKKIVKNHNNSNGQISQATIK